ncbi:DUF2971 domain-containing protein [Sphingorhabdus sp.]|uniref:DUF2971 domain-containing protein n=1 Tax=Sphingorhabdus sp. TaxID=1902408 RepID=UPI0032B741F8
MTSGSNKFSDVGSSGHNTKKQTRFYGARSLTSTVNQRTESRTPILKKRKAKMSLGTVYDRVFKPGPDCILYHYCSSATFLSILETGKMRFGDVNMMNDVSEWGYCYRLFESAANALLDLIPEKPALEGLNADFFDKVDDYLSPKQLYSHPVIACFSKEPDVLSQWRGYADDSRGWAIGFDGQAIAAMPVTMLNVVYDSEQQLAEVRNFLAAMYLLWREQGGEFRDVVGRDASLLASFLLAYKHPSFREEQEVRALHELRVDLTENGCQLIDEGGTADGVEVAGETVGFRAVGATIVPYVDIPLQRANGRTIREVWFGPSNPNGPGNALYPLSQHGHRAVALHRSASSYRV